MHFKSISVNMPKAEAHLLTLGVHAQRGLR